MSDQSKFSLLPKKQLIYIIEKLLDRDFPIGNPYDNDFDGFYKFIQQIGSYYSIPDPSYIDVEFFSKLLHVNEDLIAELFANQKREIRNKEMIDQLVIPSAKLYNVDYDIYGRCNYTEFYSYAITSYDEDWVTDSFQQQNNDGGLDLYEGRERDSIEYDDYQMNDYEIDGVNEVRENRGRIKESILNKLVVENTSTIVNSLDKKTLLELRRIIDSKLRLL